jgi:hypothetical protein
MVYLPPEKYSHEKQTIYIDSYPAVSVHAGSCVLRTNQQTAETNDYSLRLNTIG